MKIALVSEHASPLAELGDVDSGGQNVYVRALAIHLSMLGNEVCVYTRRTDKTAERTVHIGPRCRVHHVDAGPARHIPKDDMFPLMDDFAESLRRIWSQQPPDVSMPISGCPATPRCSLARPKFPSFRRSTRLAR